MFPLPTSVIPLIFGTINFRNNTNNTEDPSLLSPGPGVRAASSVVGAARRRAVVKVSTEAVVRWRRLMALLLFIVSRSEPSRFTYLKHVFANETVDVMLDRRGEERRRRPERTAAEGRYEERRQWGYTKSHRSHGWASYILRPQQPHHT